MTVELMIAPGKAATIAIHRGDDAHTLASNFSKTYNLNKQAQFALYNILKKHIENEKNILEQQINMNAQNNKINMLKEEVQTLLESSLVSVKEDLENEYLDDNGSENTFRD